MNFGRRGQFSVVVLLTLLPLIVGCSSSSVVELNDATFEHDTQAATGGSSGDWLVMFYAPWCGHCQRSEPIFAEVAEKSDEASVVVARVNCEDNGRTCRRFGVRGYPTFLLLRRGKYTEYKGARTAEEMIHFAKIGSRMTEGTDKWMIVPPPVTWVGDLKNSLRVLWSDLQTMHEDSPWMAGLLLASTLLMMGLLLTLLVSILRQQKATAPKAAAKPTDARDTSPKRKAKKEQ